MSEKPTKEELSKWIDDQINLLEIALSESFGGKSDAVNKSLKKELMICKIIRQTIQNQLIKSKKNGIILGRIGYYLSWQQFVFIPSKGTVWSWDCLIDIINKLKELNHKEIPARIKENA